MGADRLRVVWSAGVLAAAAWVGGTGATSVPASVGASVVHRPIAVVGANQSQNWSGYNQGRLEDGNESYSSVAGRWTVPTVSQHRSGQAEYSSTWVGIGGGCVDSRCAVTDNTLIQA